MNSGRTALLCELETALWTTGTRTDRAWMDAHLSPTFTEFGRSGRRYTRDDILDLPVGDIDAVLPLPDLAVRTLDHNTQLVTYRSIVGRDEANRASVWVRRDDRWQLEFHQGTPTW
jgi:hypothetical protein